MICPKCKAEYRSVGLVWQIDRTAPAWRPVCACCGWTGERIEIEDRDEALAETERRYGKEEDNG